MIKITFKMDPLITLAYIGLLTSQAKADTGDTIAWFIGLLLIFIFVCAGIGAYARRNYEGYK